jgi:hypothetical protein
MADSEPGIGRKILSFFIKDTDETVPGGQAPGKPVAGPAPEPSKPATPATVPNAAGTGQVDRKFVEHFVNLLEKANLPGPDYFEYKQALQSMEGLGLGEEKQFQAAWASFKAMGGAKDTAVLKTSADQYLGMLGKDRDSFLKDVEKAVKERVGALQDEHKKLEDTNMRLTLSKSLICRKKSMIIRTGWGRFPGKFRNKLPRSMPIRIALRSLM